MTNNKNLRQFLPYLGYGELKENNMKLKIEERRIIRSYDWNNFVREIYNKPYDFQQQDGCKGRGVESIYASKNEEDQDYDGEAEIPLEINGDKMCVKFKVWLNTDPKEHQEKMGWKDWEVSLFWERNFYPHIDVLVNDLCRKGLLEEGGYDIQIDW